MEETDFLPVGDARRSALSRGVLGGLALGAALSVYLWLGKQIRPLYLQAPWAEDPYDALYSFGVFFAALLTALGVLRISLCHRLEPLPLRRMYEILLGNRLILVISGVALLSQWFALLTGTHRHAWSYGTMVLVAALAALTALSVRVALGVKAAFSVIAEARVAAGPDWIEDLLAVARRVATHTGSRNAATLAAIDIAETTVARWLRRHSILCIAAASLLFGLGISLLEALGEGGWNVPFLSGPALLLVVVGAAGMFAFLVACGLHLRLLTVGDVRAQLALRSSAVGFAAVPLTLGFRSQIPWLAGIAADPTGHHLLAACLCSGLVAGTVAMAANVAAARLGRRTR